MRDSGVIGIVLIVMVVVLTGCSDDGGGSNDSYPIEPLGDGSGIVMLSGRTSPPVSGGKVEIKSLNGVRIGSGTTASDGGYSIQVESSILSAGYEVTVTGGEVGGNPFTATLIGLYTPQHDNNSVNPTIITTLLAELSKGADDRLLKRDEIIELLEKIGVIGKSEWYLPDSEYVDIHSIWIRILNMGFDRWISEMEKDLADGELSPYMMTGLPLAHGGIVQATIDSNNIINVFPGDSLSASVTMVSYGDSRKKEYAYYLVKAPQGATIDDSGTIFWKVPESYEPEMIPVEIEVANRKTGIGRRLSGKILVMDKQVVAKGVVGPEGGEISDAWEDVVLEIPPGALEEQSAVEVIRGTNGEGGAVYTIRSSVPLKKPAFLQVPDQELIKSMLGYGKFPEAASVDNVDRCGLGEGKGTVWICHRASYVDVLPKVSVLPNIKIFFKIKNRVSSDSKFPIMPFIFNYSFEPSSRLISLCGTKQEYVSRCGGRNTVLFVHGYTKLGWFGGGMAHGENSWNI